MITILPTSHLDVVEIQVLQRSAVALQFPEALVDVRVVRLFHLEGLAGLALGDRCMKERTNRRTNEVHFFMFTFLIDDEFAAC